jgi:hypothetical protein
MDRDIHKDFDIFSRALIVSGDDDPTYPVVRKIVNHYNFQPEWFTFMYVSFYNLESAIEVCKEMPTMRDWKSSKFIQLREHIKLFGHERRGTNRIILNQVNALEHIIRNFKLSKTEDNLTLRKKIEKYPFHGPWAAFKIAEIFEKSFDYSNLTIKDLGIDDRDVNRSDGPIGGLRWLYGRDNVYDDSYKKVWNNFGNNLSKAWGVDIGKTETVLCKFHKLVSGKYYPAHDVDELYELKNVLGDKAYKSIVVNTFPKLNEIKGVNKNLKGLYKREGTIMYEELANELPSADVYQILMDTN